MAAKLGNSTSVRPPKAAQASGAARSQLNPTEKAIVQAVSAQKDEGVALLEKLVNINSGTMNLAGVRATGDVVRKELDALGFQTRWVDGSSFGRAGHLLAERTGTGPRLLLIGHLDTVFEPSTGFDHFERLDKNTVKGPGISDMKGGDVVMLQALKALKAAGALESMSITVVFTGDEEAGGTPRPLARAALVEAAKQSQVAIGFEDGADDPTTAVTARRGTTSWMLESTGKPAHASMLGSERVGYGAIYESARVVNDIRMKLLRGHSLTINPAVSAGGSEVRAGTSPGAEEASGKTNVVPEHAVIRGEIRALTPKQLERVKSALRTLAAHSLPGTHSDIRFVDGVPPLAPSAGNHRLLSVFSQASEAVGMGPVTAVDPMRAGAADVSYTARYLPAAIDGLGLPGTGVHTRNETADLRLLSLLTQRAAVFLYRMTRTPVRSPPPSET
jgi:glutamate carboxypeptidase